jgi:very-short-patch-repair endonuclease
MNSSFETNIERKVRRELEKRGYRRGIDFSCQYPLRYSYIIDLAFPKQMLAVETDGNYWHSKSNIKKRDAYKNSILKKLGWTVLRISEDDILINVSLCVDKITKILEFHGNGT